ncbi:M60 family metallopeptidase [Curtobacterium sp. MCJR17_020]|uniref:M60 family metallopeptidase n=1 Tax=Curtobacterium sp. MCJR17_020 TaxID=2175619 RepID=UPI000DAA36FC|nr:M60 family metallopeptidase [Curtobacterium sp. MCJR17_020]WIE72656.1 M60 family metallopeptidase [Curtobacterium sp. MCJR17_020]
MRRSVLLPAALVALALIIGGGTTSPATAGQPRVPSETSIVHSDDGTETRVLVHGIGSASAAATAEGRRFPHSDLQPAGRFVESGDVVTVTVPPGAPAMEVAIGLIGTYAAHNDGRDVGYRRTPVASGVNEVTAPHDGMVSLVSTAPEGTATATISGGEPVPTWVRGQSTPESFAADFARWADAPFVEIVSERMFGDFQKPKTGTVIPSDDLVARTANWDRVVELTNETYGLHDDAVGTSHKHRHRIHIVSPDTGGGYANAGSGRIMFQVSTGAGGDLFRDPIDDQWALWHEVGHTYEAPINSFPGTAETITNISSLAVQDGLGFPSRWDQSTAAFREYFASDDRDWLRASDRIRLLAWEQLRRAFGDAFLPRFFAALRAESAATNPHVVTNDERHALFVTVASRVADRNLAPFYDELGFPVSDATRAAVAAYPELEQRIWDNVDSRNRIVEHIIPGYDPPVVVVEPVVGPVPVGRRVVDAPDVTGLGTASGRGSATVVDATAVADVVGEDTGRLVVRLRSGDGTEDSIIVTTVAVGADSVVARGQANRPVGVLWVDGAGALGWRAATSYSAHTSWSGQAYLQIDLRDPDGSIVRSGAVRGDQTGAVLNDVFPGQSYRDGQLLVVTHAQPSLLAVYGADVPITGAGAPQAYRIEDHHLVPVPREEIPGWEVIRGVDGEHGVLERGEDVAVEAGLSVHALVTVITATITMESPDGTTFAPGQETLAVAYRKPGEDWRSSASLALRNGTRSPDGRSMTYSLQTGSSFSLPPGSFLRWEPVVRVAADARAGESALELVAEGNAH